MVSVDEFRELCRTHSALEIVDHVLLADEAAHVTSADRDYLKNRLEAVYGVVRPEIDIWIVGSAKLGFSPSENRRDELPRYRPFGPRSDIDVAVVSPDLFRHLWDAIGVYAHGQPWFPWASGKLGDYMVYGWLRPDHFPRVRQCDIWLDTFRALSKDRRFGFRKVRGGLYHSVDDLRRYLRRTVDECIREEKSK